MPSDDVSVFYKTSGDLCRVLKQFSEHIRTTTKSPVIDGPPPASSDIVIHEKTKVCHCRCHSCVGDIILVIDITYDVSLLYIYPPQSDVYISRLSKDLQISPVWQTAELARLVHGGRLVDNV